jgi:hypothetical protein
MNLSYKLTREAMRPLSWRYKYSSWDSIPFLEKGFVFSAYCEETKNDCDEDVFMNKSTRRNYSMIFSQIASCGGLEYVEAEVLYGFVKDLMIELSLRANETLEDIFESEKPSEEELKEAADIERAELEN